MRQRTGWGVWALCAAAILPCGCTPQGGLLITPVPADKRLTETVLRRDAGLAVTDQIVIVEVDGLLVNAESGPMFGPKENPVSLFCEKLDKAAGDPNVKAVIIRVNSPGGTVGASELMYRRLVRFTEQRKDVKIAAAITDVGASGGYYVACGARKIYAMPSSLTGSIGVIFQTFSLEGLLAKIGVETLAIKSGPNKDLASPFRNRRPEEVALLQKIIDNYYESFLSAVLTSRTNLNRQALLPLADGRVYTGTQALQAGLVDNLLDVDEVVMLLKNEAGLSRAKVVMYQRPTGYKGSIYAQSDLAGGGPTINLLNVDLGNLPLPQPPRFLYLWTGP